MALIVFDVASALRKVSIEHVYGHRAHHWNTMADFIASGTMRGDIPEVPPSWAEATRFQPSRRWEWLWVSPTEVRSAFPPMCGDTWVSPPADTTASLSDVLGFDGPEGDAAKRPRLCVSMSVC